MNGCALETVGGLSPGGTGGTTSQSLLPLQVKSREISSEQWKGSETYSPNTAYGNKPPVSATASQTGTPTSIPTQSQCDAQPVRGP